MNSYIALEQFARELRNNEYIEDEFDFEKHKRVIFWGVKTLGFDSDTLYESSNANEKLTLYQFLSELIDRITPRQLMTVFPIEKEYDGRKYEMKDYFYSIEKCKEHGLDVPIGNSFDFLWDYHNRDTGGFIVKYMSTLSDVTKYATGQGLMETYLAEIGVTTYTEKIIDGKSVLVENLTFNSKGKLV